MLVLLLWNFRIHRILEVYYTIIDFVNLSSTAVFP